MKCARVISRTQCPSLRRAPFPTCATASSPCSGASFTQCARSTSHQTNSIASARASSVKSSRVFTRTATRRSMMRSCAWRKILPCVIRSSTVTETSVRSTAIRRLRTGTPKRGSRASRWRCSRRSTKTRSISSPISTTKARSPSSYRRVCRSCWSTAAPGSRSAWRPIFRRTTSARSAMRSRIWSPIRATRPTFSTTRSPISCWDRIFRPAGS